MITFDDLHEYPQLNPPFEGRPVRDVLNSRYWKGVGLARDLPRSAFDDAADPAADILSAIEASVPVVARDAGNPWKKNPLGQFPMTSLHKPTGVRTGNCGLQYYASTFDVQGNADALTWVPIGTQGESSAEHDTHQEKIAFRTTRVSVTVPNVGTVTGQKTTLYVIFLGESLTQEQVTAGTERWLDYLERTLATLQAECDAWRDEITPRICEEVEARKRWLRV